MESDRAVAVPVPLSPRIQATSSPPTCITFVARTVMNRLVGDYSFDEVIGPKRSDIANEARTDTQRILDAYECGITDHGPADAAGDPSGPGQAGVRQGQRLDPGEAEAGERGRVGPEQAASRGPGLDATS